MHKLKKKDIDYGNFMIEYRESKDGLLSFYQKKIDTFEQAQVVRERLIQSGYHEPVIKRLK